MITSNVAIHLLHTFSGNTDLSVDNFQQVLVRKSSDGTIYRFDIDADLRRNGLPRNADNIYAILLRAMGIYVTK